MTRRKTPAKADAIEQAWVEAIEAQLRVRGALPVRGLTPVPLTKRAEAALFEALARRGFERTARFVRAPLERQIAARLATAALLPVAGLAKQLAGATQTEVKQRVKELLRTRSAVLVVRDGKEHLARASVDVVTREELEALSALVKALGKRLRAVKTRRGQPPRTLLADEIRAELARVTLDRPSSSASSTASTTETILAALARLETSGIPLVFIPRLAGELDLEAEALKRGLLEAAREAKVELRPESGVGLLRPEEAAVCPTGPAGMILSYARRLEGGGGR